MTNNVYGIDLGTCNMKIYCKSSNKILNEKNTIALKNKDIRKKYADLIKEFTERPTDAYYDSPVVILFFSKDSPTKVLDGAAALENMLLATAAIDLGACWIHRSSFFFASEKGKQFQKEIGIGEEYECLESIALGYIKGDKPQFKERVEGSKII